MNMGTTPRFKSFAQFFDSVAENFVDKCILCGQCLTKCPVFLNPKFGLVDKGPEAIVEKVVDLIKGGQVSPEAYIMVYGCSHGCTNICGHACPQGLDFMSIFMAASHRLQKAGKGLPPGCHQYTPGHRYAFSHVLGDLQIKESEVPWLKEVPAHPEPVDVVLYNSCTTLGMPNLILTAIDILNRMGINFVTLGGHNLCCGAAILSLGDIDGAQKASQNYISTMARFHPKKVVTLCEGCALMGRAFLPMCFSVPFEAQHITDFLAENLDKLQFTRVLNKVVTVHDSCTQRKYGGCEAPRKLLRAIPGVTLVEMEHNRENNLCCGGVTDWNYPRTRDDIRFARAEEARAVDADAMATVCPGCQCVFSSLEEMYPFEVKHTISLVGEAMGIYHEDKLKKYLLTKDTNKVLDEAKDYVESSDLSLMEFQSVLPACLERLQIGTQKCVE